MTARPPRLVIEVPIEEPVTVYSTARTEGEQVRLEDDLRARGEGLLEEISHVFEPLEERCAA